MITAETPQDYRLWIGLQTSREGGRGEGGRGGRGKEAGGGRERRKMGGARSKEEQGRRNKENMRVNGYKSVQSNAA